MNNINLQSNFNKNVSSDLKLFLSHANQQLQNKVFITRDGQAYPRRKLDSDFQNDLEVALSDPEKGIRIAKSFEKHLAPVVSGQEKEILQKWLLKNVRFLGFFPFDQYYRGDFPSAVQAIMQHCPEHMANFFEEIRLKETPTQFSIVRDLNVPCNIVIITTTGGGGHKSVADALKSTLDKYPLKYHATVIDIAEISKRSDPLFLLSGLLSAEEIYDKIYQQQKNCWLAQQLWELKPKLNPFVADTSMSDLKKKIRELKPDLVISTCHHLERDLDVASSLCIPFRFIHCDYELSWSLIQLVAKGNPEAIKLWLPAQDPELLRPMSSQLKSELVNQLRIDHTEAELDALIAEKTKEIIQYSGYPVRPAFRTAEEEEKQKIRERLKISKDTYVVPIQMGKQGVGTLEKVVMALNENLSVVYDHPLHIAVLCGTNEELREKLLAYLAKTPQHPQVEFVICPLLNQQETADYLKIADVEIMKPGGAATAEALKVGVRTLILIDQGHPWEMCNKEQMLRHKVGIVAESIDSIPKQLREMLQQSRSIHYCPIDAEEQVPRLIDESIRDFNHYHLRSIPTDAVFKRTAIEYTTVLYDMLDVLHLTLHSNGITYWSSGGTRLGQDPARGSGLIPWDDDGDIQIYHKDKENLLALTDVFEKQGFLLKDHQFGFKLFPRTGYFPSVDIFTAVEDPLTGHYFLGYPEARATWPNDYWTKEELSQIEPLAFGPIHVMGCKNADRYLTTSYGSNYREVGYRIWDHEKNRFHLKVAVRLVDRSCAPYLSYLTEKMEQRRAVMQERAS